MKSISLSLCMIVKNEEEVISRCLDSVEGLFDEIIIVDTGSTDKTKEIVKKYTDKIYDFKWVNDFSKARNYSFSKSTSDYNMWLDADDVIDKEELKKLKEFKKHINSDIDLYIMHHSCMEDKDGNTTYLQDRARIIKNNKKYKWHGKVHEYIKVIGKSENIDITIRHKKIKVSEPERNLNIYRDMLRNKEKFNIRDLFLYATELYNNGYIEESLTIINKVLKQKDKYIDNNFYFESMIIIKYKIYLNRKDTRKAKKILIDFLEYAAPTPNICCQIGYLFNLEKKYNNAIFWYNSARLIAKEKPDPNVEYNEFTPFFVLAYSYYKLNDKRKALFYNNKALMIYPNNETCLKNQEIYKSF